MNENQLVFVYGSLRQGKHNHSLLVYNNAKLIDRGCIQGSLRAREHDSFPYATLDQPGDQNNTIHGEIYEVSPACMKALDRLEGYPDFYNRRLVLVVGEDMPGQEWGNMAWAYHCEAAADMPVVESGNWLDFHKS